MSDGTTVRYGDTEIEGGADDHPPVTTAPEAVQYHWILNVSTQKIHRADCSSASKISESNRTESDKSVSALIAEGYSACGTYKPVD